MENFEIFFDVVIRLCGKFCDYKYVIFVSWGSCLFLLFIWNLLKLNNNDNNDIL